jgi:hypothetical protein
LKKSILGGLVSALLLASTSAYAQGGITITVNENCVGTLNAGLGLLTLPCSLLADPGPGGLPSAVTYGLLNPPGLVAGDLILQEFPGGPNSEIIRFNPGQNGGSMVFYSDNLDGGLLDLADTGFPLSFYTNTLTALEVGPEGTNGFTYTPTAGQPGFVAGAGAPVTYVIQSDVSSPEPASAALILAGAGILLARRQMLKRRAG